MPNQPESLVVQIRANGTLGREERLLADLAEQMGIAVVEATEKKLERRKIRLDAGSVAVGSVPFVRHALGQFGKALPLHTPYPAELQDMLHRRIEKVESLRLAKSRLESRGPMFIKPADGWKRFTGFVAEFAHDYRFGGASNSKPVWTSDPIVFVSEWRAYVANGEVLDVRFADHGGDRNKTPDHSVIHAAVSRLENSRTGPRGYVIDFGVLVNGETALIEMNDGFSMGAYDGVSAETYWAVTVSRWQELVGRGS